MPHLSDNILNSPLGARGINSICICGAGTMGSGIAQVSAQSGFYTILFDVNESILQKAKESIEKNLAYLAGKQKISEEQKEEIFQRIKFVTDNNDCLADVIIEAIVEKTEAKVSLFNQLAELNHAEVIFATNTSSLSVSEIQKNSDAPANHLTPNGFTGEEACMLTRFAGMSPALSSFGIYGYKPEDDVKELTAKQIAQMLWYFFDGKSRSKQEAGLEDKHQFNEFHTAFTDIDTVFLQSKKTGRWWMQLPDKKMIACSYNDYVNASNNQIPERWLRAQERI